MSGSFDPYHKWLGISPKDQPPNHYRLLAIDLFESDPDVISSAADQRMAHVRAFQTGKHSALSQQILNEIAAARVCLLNAEKREEYDRQLREQFELERGPSEPADEAIQARREPPVLPPIPPATPPLDEPVAPRFEGPEPRPWLRRKRRMWQALAGILVAAILVLAILTAVLTRGDSEEVVAGDPQPPPITQSGPTDPPETGGPVGTEGEDPPDAQSEPPEANLGGASGQTSPPEPPPVKPPETGQPEKSPTHGVGQGKAQTADPPPQTPPQKASVPDAAARADAEQRLEGIVAAASAAEFLAAAGAQERTPDERFVLLERARDIAATDGDVETALAAADEILRRYEIDALAVRVATFNGLRDSVKSPSAYRGLAEQGIALFDELVAEGKKDLAKQIAVGSLVAARKSGDNDLQGEATKRWLKFESLP